MIFHLWLLLPPVVGWEPVEWVGSSSRGNMTSGVLWTLGPGKIPRAGQRTGFGIWIFLMRDALICAMHMRIAAGSAGGEQYGSGKARALRIR